jgi:glutaminyl-peptide cyclotransferase
MRVNRLNAPIRCRLVALALLALLPLVICIGALIQSRPNTAGVPLIGPFDGKLAFAHLKRLVAFGPRPSGSEALERAREFIIGELRAAGLSVTEDEFTATTAIGPIFMTNIVAKIPGASPLIVIIGGHYDTKRMAAPFVGANDGGSSAAFLLEMARVLARKHNKLTYWLVFFDGEEALKNWSATDGLYGSRHFTEGLSTRHGLQSRIAAMILVDMIADAHLDIRREARSTPWLNDLVLNEATRLGYRRYFVNRPRRIDDDHLPFLELGIPAVDIIDLDYGPLNLYWHTPYDTPYRCSPASLGIVGAVVLQALSAVESRVPLCYTTVQR